MIYGPGPDGDAQDRNVPEQVRDGALATLRSAINEANRQNKIVKFGYCPTSEDALTWTVFKFLHQSGQLTSTLRLSGLLAPGPDDPLPALVLWGASVPLPHVDGSLLSVSNWLLETPRRRTEPDVLIDMGQHGLIIVEVKHRSGTAKRDIIYPHWNTYYPSCNPIRQSRCYELARNWRFGMELTLSPRRPFTLVYLGPNSLFLQNDPDLHQFEACVAGDGLAQFRTLAWNAFLGAITEKPQWFVDYVQSRGYLQGI